MLLCLPIYVVERETVPERLFPLIVSLTAEMFWTVIFLKFIRQRRESPAIIILRLVFGCSCYTSLASSDFLFVFLEVALGDTG